MGRRPPDRRLRRLAAVVALLCCASACSTPASAPVASDIPTRLEAALRAHDSDSFLTAFAPDADAQSIGSSWYAALDAGGGVVSADGERRLRISSTLPGDRRTASEAVSYDLADGSDRIGAVSAVAGPLPVWSLPGVEVTATSAGTMLSGSLDAAARQRWATRLEQAAATVAKAGVGEDWQGGLVVEVPPPGHFEEVSGASAADTSAITVCAAGTPRIVMNPVILEAGQDWTDSTLVHEAVHVATDSACADAGSSLAWAVEGLAESVAAASDEATATRNRALAAAYVGEHGVPDALPERVRTLTDYALAQVAADQVREHLGAEAQGFWRRAIHHSAGVTPAELRAATGWYRDALARFAR